MIPLRLLLRNDEQEKQDKMFQAINKTDVVLIVADGFFGKSLIKIRRSAWINSRIKPIRSLLQQLIIVLKQSRSGRIRK